MCLWFLIQSAQASKPVPVETQHEDMIVSLACAMPYILFLTNYSHQHDAQLDYYGKRLATCSSDRTIRIFNVIKGEAKGEPVILKGYIVLISLWLGMLMNYRHRHTAAVWQVSWAHPSFGSILASCSYDGRVFIWKEVGQGQGKGSGGELQDGWERIKEHTLHTASGKSKLTEDRLIL